MRLCQGLGPGPEFLAQGLRRQELHPRLPDEANSFLGDRCDAVRSRQITHIDRLLTPIEEFEGTFLCATSLMERLDPASLRRFAFRLRFD